MPDNSQRPLFLRGNRYQGHQILRCHWDGAPHGGRWYVQSYHATGMVWADEATPHHRTLAEAREYIDEKGLDYGCEAPLWGFPPWD
jgi:hypothetical protein